MALLSINNTEFTQNISKTFSEIRNSQEFSDVTLVCEDGEIEAHCLVLASGSNFFEKVLSRKNDGTKTLVFMRGVKRESLTHLLDFLYCGEANVLEGNLQEFIFLSNDLGLKGFSYKDSSNHLFVPQTFFDLEVGRGTISKNQDSSKFSLVPGAKVDFDLGAMIPETGEIIGDNEKKSFQLEEMLTPSFQLKVKPVKDLTTQSNNKLAFKDETEIDGENITEFAKSVLTPKIKLKATPTETLRTTVSQRLITGYDLEDLMEKVDKVWSCKMCGKTSGRQKDHLRDHVKIHIQPSQMSCRLCGKVFKNQWTEETHMKTCKGQRFQGNSLFRVKNI